MNTAGGSARHLRFDVGFLVQTSCKPLHPRSHRLRFLLHAWPLGPADDIMSARRCVICLIDVFRAS